MNRKFKIYNLKTTKMLNGYGTKMQYYDTKYHFSILIWKLMMGNIFDFTKYLLNDLG